MGDQVSDGPLGARRRRGPLVLAHRVHPVGEELERLAVAVEEFAYGDRCHASTLPGPEPGRECAPSI